MNIFCTTNKGWEKVKTVWTGAERSAQIKETAEQRDLEGTLIFPRISITRTDFNKDPNWKGIVQAHVPNTPDYKGGTLTIAKVINDEKSANYANAQSMRTKNGGVGHGQINFKTKKIHPTVFTFYTAPLPVWVQIVYKVDIRTEYIQQMNEILQPFITYAGQITSFFIESEGHRYECFFDSGFTTSNNVDSMTDEERRYESSFTVKCQAYLMGADKNQEYPKTTERENAVEFKMKSERVIVSEEREHMRNHERKYIR